MDPLTGTIDKLEKALGHSPHPAVVTLPIGAWMVSNISDGLSVLTGDDAYEDTARVSMAIGLVGAAGAAMTGLRDYGFIPQDRQPNHDVATTHGLGNALAGTLFITSYVLLERTCRRVPCWYAFTLALACGWNSCDVHGLAWRQARRGIRRGGQAGDESAEGGAETDRSRESRHAT